MNEVTISNKKNPAYKYQSDKYASESFLLANSLKKGRTNTVRNIAMAKASNETRNDSTKNCLMSCFLVEPITFLIPISLLRLRDWPIARLMKLMQAMMSIKIAMQLKM